MSSVCPGCGVAVVPGYVRCPKCHTSLSASTTTGRIRRIDEGGTAMPDRSFPLVPVLLGLAVLVAMILVFGTRGSKARTAVEAAPTIPEPVAATPIHAAATPRPAAIAVAPVAAATGPTTADLGAASHALEAALRQARLWGRVDIAGARVDVRSGSCSDRTMRPTIDGQAALLRGAGLTKLRCVEQSGAIVFERDL